MPAHRLVVPEPRDRRMLATWLSYDDLERLVVACLTAPVVGFSIVYGMSRQPRRPGGTTRKAAPPRLPRRRTARSRTAPRSRRASRSPTWPTPPPRYQGGAFVNSDPSRPDRPSDPVTRSDTPRRQRHETSSHACSPPRCRRRCACAAGAAEIPLGRRAQQRRLPDRRRRQAHERAARQAQQRQVQDQGLQQGRAGQREGNDRPGQDRRARHDARQHQPDERASAPRRMVPTMPFLFRLDRAHAQGARRPGRRGDPEGLRAPGLRRPGLLRQRRALDLRQEAGQDAGRRQGHEDPRAAVRPVGRAGRRDGRQRHADADRRGLHRPEDRPDRRRREQHPVVRRLQALRGGQVLLAHRALDGARDAADVARSCSTSCPRPTRT